jgi:hypothetical protein
MSSLEALSLHGSIHAAAAFKYFSVSVTYSCKFVYGIGSKVCHLREHFAENFFFLLMNAINIRLSLIDTRPVP